MEKRHFQMQELRLKCIAYYHNLLKFYQKTITIRTIRNEDGLQYQPNVIQYSNTAAAAASALPARQG